MAALPGDGIGTEVLPAAQRVLDIAGERFGFRLEWHQFTWGAEYFVKHGRMMSVDALDKLGGFDAIFLGAVGAPDISDVETLWGMLIPIRREFDQYVNLRPVRSLPGIESPLKHASDVDLVIVRENVEGEYSAVGGRSYQGQPEEAAYQQSLFTRRGIERVTRFAADLAGTRSGRITSATKSNGIIHTMPFWDEVVSETLSDYPDIQLTSVLIDALAASLILHPSRHDVIVASNLFGDILSDLAAAMVGSIGIAPSANLNPGRKHPSMFEPVHGSAPDIAGLGIANPVGQVWAGALMLEHLGHDDAAAAIVAAIEATLASGVMTSDIGGTATTEQATNAIIESLVSTD
ncbi:tartrate dehydrogenase [Leifsonia sp. 2MCAF36]|uniref:tartrate dehydrogenase n=1 Tax=Leifsonia sp. 2MCAF36 TaxID=3232988 RepID=UPI003F9B43DD